MAFSTYSRNAAINALLRNTALSLTPYASLHTADPTVAGASELAVANGYIRKAVVFGAPSGGASSNSPAISFGPATPAGWSEVGWWGVWDQVAVGGNFIWGAAMTNARTAGIGDTIDAAVAALTAAITGDWGTYARNALINALLRATSLAVASTKISLHSGDPGLDGANELTGNAYARQTGAWDAPNTGVTQNTSLITFPTATPGAWGNVTHFGVWDAGSNFIAGHALTVTPKAVGIGETAKFPIGSLVVTA